MKLAIMSDIHANLTAYKAVVEEINRRGADKFVLLGDLINYGMRPNEVVEMTSQMDGLFVAKIWVSSHSNKYGASPICLKK